MSVGLSGRPSSILYVESEVDCISATGVDVRGKRGAMSLARLPFGSLVTIRVRSICSMISRVFSDAGLAVAPVPFLRARWDKVLR